ncbi:MAG: T9SS type A sorting domain-containing protein [Paludibacter sp.]|nr:T9SS type A sorting domain-containing protein [Paludibacter sp.]
MKRIFTFAIALMSLFSAVQLASAANVTFNVTVPAGTNACWIVGNFNGWNNNDKKMTKVDATHYTITMDDTTWGLDGGVQVTTANIKYKYLSGGGTWAYVEKDAAGTELNDRTYVKGTTIANPDPAKTTIPGNDGNDVVQKWALVWEDVPPLPMNVTIDVMVPAGTIQCYIVGTFNNWAGPTAPVDSVKMVKVATNDDGTMVFEKTIFTADAHMLAYHFCSGPDWSYEQLAPTGDYKYPTIAPIVTSWKKVYDPAKVGTIVVTITVPANTAEVWSVGSFQGWSMDNAVACTKNTDGTFTFTVNNTGGFEYKLFNKKDNSWGYNAVDAAGKDIANTAVSYPENATSAVTVVAWKQNLSAVQAINMDNYRIYTANHSVVVEGVTAQVDIYDASGRTVQSQKVVGTFSSKNLNSGLYIIRIDGATTKVSLR